MPLRKYYTTLRAQKRPLRFIVGRLLKLSHLSSLFWIRKGKFKMKFFPSSVSFSLWLDPECYSFDESFFEEYLKHNDNVIDVGSNVGHLTLKAASILENTGNILSIEPNPKVFFFLQKNISYNNYFNIKAYNFALGDVESSITFQTEKADNTSHVSELEKNGITLKQLKLDDIVNKQFNSIALLKIDVEGYEKFVIKGSKKTLEKTKVILFESYENNFARFNYSLKEIFDYLIAVDFKIYKFIGKREIIQIDSNYLSNECENLLAIKDIDEFFERTNYSINKNIGS